ncbi:hypothetical protein F959_01688 [Acinetobacter venetianus RAG-1 = CIP 110063]|uniref:Uncharacterized protein n=1 Tax=Acinetobacter venetianus (strain ATCC 31012 / DSM 23050 / BCRC 14357 / CCUG 45561 / CIP 110063 / KCTC 2702 / LMG 19082 / RAG-1) TaxID=1191460 RepID=N8YJK1_ACIVR|nr:hypothetical protein [Acinetobacter venetianus]ENV36881.1 hypothetical protein F959_01688 [Acinetobacter venetianus RAG-1 = CIP 110063]
MSDKLAGAQVANAEQTIQPVDYSADPFWGYVSKHKFAEFSLCTMERNPDTNEPYFSYDTSQPTIRAFLTDGDINFESQWQTPFENSNPELKMPMMMAALQTGQAVASGGVVGTAFGGLLGDTAAGLLTKAFKPIAEFAKSVEGKTNLNKVNTTQVFLSTASVHLNLSVFFIALKDARAEVENKLMHLQSWSLPAQLSQGTVLTDLVDQGVDGLFSGLIPPYITVTTHGKTYIPFILQSVSAPIVAPIDKEGNRLSLTVNLSLISRTAWDAQDVRNLYAVK